MELNYFVIVSGGTALLLVFLHLLLRVSDHF